MQYEYESEREPRSILQVPHLKQVFSRGLDPNDVKPVTEDINADLLERAPFAHLKIHITVAPVEDDDIEVALERARAQARVAQMRDPGVRRAFAPMRLPNGGTGECKMDRTRPAEVEVEGPTDDQSQMSETWHVSRASAARWHYGRALRQRLYERAREELGLNATAFCDDFGEMVAPPLPKPRKEDLPVAARGKLAVFCADGDGFTELRAKLIKKLGPANGRAALTEALTRNMDSLIETLARELFELGNDESDDIRTAAVALPNNRPGAGRRDPVPGAARLTRIQRNLGIDRLHRFETLTFGGEDIVFVVPAWLGWRLALRFFALTNLWEVGAEDIGETMRDPRPQGGASGGLEEKHEFPMRFSAGLGVLLAQDANSTRARCRR